MFLIPVGQITSPIQSQYRKFDPKSLPTYSIHLTDLYINPNNVQSVFYYKKALEVSSNYSTEHVFITGNIADNQRDEELNYGHQTEIDFLNYKLISQKFHFPFFQELAGNHDEFGLSSYNSYHHYFRKYTSWNGTFDAFQASVYYYEKQAFIQLNPFEYPSPRALVDFYARPNLTLLDRIDLILSTIRNVENSIILTHFPVEYWQPRGSGKTISSIIQENQISMIITGHVRPRLPEFFHIGSTLQIIGCSLADTGRIGFLSSDNENLVYTSIDVMKPPKIIVTNPTPREQINLKTSFALPIVHIRALVFTNKRVRIRISGDADGIMTRIAQVKPGVYLYQLTAEFSEGERVIRFSGDHVQTLRFFVGDSLPPFVEITQTTDHKIIPLAYLSIMLDVYMILLIFNPFSKSFRNLYALWVLNGIEVPVWKKIIFILFGFQLWTDEGKFFSILKFIALTAPVIPLSFFRVENYTGLIICMGFYLGKRITSDPICSILFGLFLINNFFIPIVFIRVCRINQKCYYLSLYVLIQSFSLSFIPVIKWLPKAAGISHALKSPAFCFLNLIITILGILQITVYQRKK